MSQAVASPVTVFYTVMVLVVVMVFILSIGAGILIRSLNPEPTRAQSRLASVVNTDEERPNAFSTWVQSQTSQSSQKENNGPLARLLKVVVKKFNFSLLLTHAGMTISPQLYALYGVILPIATGWTLCFTTHQFLWLAVCIIGPAAGWGLVKFKAFKRIGLMESQLPDALAMLASSLRAGYSFQAAMNLLAEQLPTPIVSIFTNLNNDLKLGVTAKESFAKMIEEVPVPDYRIFSTAVLVQREVGGNLAEVMDRLAYTIRERFKLKRQVSVLTAQPRLSGYILAAAPTFMFFVFYFFFNSYIQPLYTNLFGQIAMVIAFCFQLGGFYVMWRIVDIKY